MTDNPTLPLVDWLRKVAPKHKEGTARKLAFNMDGLCLQELNAKINEAADALEAAQRRVSELEAVLEPFADYHGDLPDYDSPLRPCFESGIQYAVELLAKILNVEDWEICDGTEEFDGDLGGTLLNIVIKTWPVDEHGDWIDLRDPTARAALAKDETARGAASEAP